MHSGYYDNGGAHWGLWIVMIVALLVFFAIVAWAVVHLIRQRDAQAVGDSPTRQTRRGSGHLGKAGHLDG